MKKVMKGHLGLKELQAGPEAIEAFPDGYSLPWTVYVRQTYRDHLKDLPGGVEATWPGVGVLTFTGLKYEFVFTEKYATLKGYEHQIEGTWG